MIAAVKLLVLALATAGVAATGALAQIPLEQAIEIHKNHLGPDSTLPEQSKKGQQTALDHLVSNQERWLANNPVPEGTAQNDTAAAEPEPES